jgi:hypothetical protein
MQKQAGDTSKNHLFLWGRAGNISSIDIKKSMLQLNNGKGNGILAIWPREP